MRVITSYWICVGVTLAFLSVLFGAAGAHWLEALKDLDLKNTYETAVRFQMFHSLSLMIIGLIINLKLAPGKLLIFSPFCIFLGTIIFCGSLYIISLSSLKWFGAVAPVGGVLLLAGWLIMGIAILNERGRRNNTE